MGACVREKSDPRGAFRRRAMRPGPVHARRDARSGRGTCARPHRWAARARRRAVGRRVRRCGCPTVPRAGVQRFGRGPGTRRREVPEDGRRDVGPADDVVRNATVVAGSSAAMLAIPGCICGSNGTESAFLPPDALAVVPFPGDDFRTIVQSELAARPLLRSNGLPARRLPRDSVRLRPPARAALVLLDLRALRDASR
jgi:hypothetical protein